MASIEHRVDKLTSDNYSTWRTIVKSQLMSKELWDYVIQTKHSTDEDKLKNEQAKTIMYIAMEASQIAATGVCTTAYELWTKIRENHEGSISNLRSTSLAEFLSTRYRKNESIVTFAGRYENSLGKLESTGHTVDEKTKLWVFSNSLPEPMKVTVRMFTMSSPDGLAKDLISVMKAQHHQDHHQNDNQAAAYHTQDSNQPTENGLIKSNNQNRFSTIICTFCKNKGHSWKECRKLKADQERKKKFGQSRNNRPNNHQQSHPNQTENNCSANTRLYKPTNSKLNEQQPNKQSSGAFNARAHNFSAGKYSWIIDSGASNHLTPYREFLSDYEEFETPHSIIIGDGNSLQAYGQGKVPFESEEFEGTILNVLWVPKMKENLFSIGKAVEQGCNVQFSSELSKVLFYKGEQLVLRGTKSQESIYFLLTIKPLHEANDLQECAMVGASIDEWHKRLAHCSHNTVKALIKSDAVRGLVINDNAEQQCRSCVFGKLCRASHTYMRKLKASESAAVLHLDTVGPMRKLSIGGSRFFLLATEEFSGYKLCESISSKALIPDVVKRIINTVELESTRPVKMIVSDNGTEFTSMNLQNWLSRRGIVQSFATTYTPEQNGRAERANRTILDGIRTLLNESKLPEELWAEALNTVVYTTNRILGSGNSQKTRFELFTGSKPDVSNLRIFGQRAVVRESDNAREGKLAPRGEEATFVGYTERSNTYRFYIEKPMPQIIISCDVRFLNETSPTREPEKQGYIAIVDDDEETIIDNESEPQDVDSEATETDNSTSTDSSSGSDDEAAIEQPQPGVQTRSMSKWGLFFTLEDEPRTLADAQESDDWPNWRKAMNEEMSALRTNHTWDLVDRPQNIKPIKNKWVFKMKTSPDGSVHRHKARLVAKGFTQVPNIDYKETYAPVASMNTIRMFLAIANQTEMNIVQFDIKTAFLYGDLDEVLFMEQPEFYEQDSNKVCRLRKSLYGLKQAPRQWNKKFDTFLKHFDLNQSEVDRCLYYNSDRSLLLIIYVDDGLAAGRNKNQLEKLICYLRENFELKVMECESFLGFKIIRNQQKGEKQTLSLSQEHYISKLLDKFNMTDCKPVSTPEEVGMKFNESPKLPEENLFKELVGSLLYLTTCSRPDISHAVSIASRTSQPTQAHWVALKRILRYLKGTKNMGITYKQQEPSKLVAYSDADYANDVETRRSTTGFCIFFGGGPISWRCQRQSIITLSTTEAEYVAGCELVKELLPIREQMIELNQIQSDQPTEVFIDNQSTVKIASNEAGQNRTKHIDIRAKWLTEQSLKKKIEVKKIRGDEQPADILTKPLSKLKFATNRSRLLSQIITISTLIATCIVSIDSRILKLTDPLTLLKSDKVSIEGDNRYRITSLFINPCDSLFEYTSSTAGTEFLIRNCYDYFERKHLNTLTNCKRFPTIGHDLKHISSTYNCLDNPNTGVVGNNSHTAKCDISRRQSKPSRLLELELEETQEAWNKHRSLVNSLPSLKREKRIVPLLMAGIIMATVFAGPVVKSYQLGIANSDGVQQLMNVTELHSKIIKDSTIFFDQYRNSVSAIHSWAEDIEEKLDNDPLLSRLNFDPIHRGKKANLVKTYIQWFDSQENLLSDINIAAFSKRIPPSLKQMVNGTDNFAIAASLSTLYECSFRLENKNMVLDLEFQLPIIDEKVDILRIESMDVYVSRNTTDDIEEVNCFERYVGPKYAIHNKTSGCIKPIKNGKTEHKSIRGQNCLEPGNEVHSPLNRSKLWIEDSCTKSMSNLNDHIQIDEIDGMHKIYCYPSMIKLDEGQWPCPNSPFIIEGFANYTIGNITHNGDLIDTRVTRKARSASTRLGGRIKRSPVQATVSASTIAPTTQMRSTTEPTTMAPRTKIGQSLKVLTSQMNMTLMKIKESINLLPGKFNITKIDLDSFLLAPYKTLSDGFEHISTYIKSLGSVLGVLTAVVMFIMIMPILELAMLGIKIVKIPVNLWMSSARRVVHKIRDSSPKFLKSRKKKRWDDMV